MKKNKDESYHFNRDENTVRFYPSKNEWKKKLNSIECFFAGIFVPGGLYFHGKISIQRFLVAMQATLPHFDFLYSRIHQDNDELFAIYSNEENKDNYFLQLEIEEREEILSNAILTSILPEKVDPRMALSVIDLDNLPIGTFKLTVLEDGFIISYLLNHAFFDQSSIFYFFKYLSCEYSKEICEFKKPVFYDLHTDILNVNNPIIFNDLFDFLTFGESINYKYVTEDEKNHINTYFTKPYDGIVANLIFKRNLLKKLIDDSDFFISENDIIHAILFKILAMNPDLHSAQNIHFYFIANMRKKIGLDENVMGNMLVPCQISLNSEYILQTPTLELSKLNREIVSNINRDKFKNQLSWFENLQKFNKKTQDFVLLNVSSSSHSWMISNWASFDYKSIKFDDSSPFSLKTVPLPPQARSILICFDDLNNEEVLTTSIGLPATCLNSVIEFGQSSNLFSVIISGNR